MNHDWSDVMNGCVVWCRYGLFALLMSACMVHPSAVSAQTGNRPGEDAATDAAVDQDQPPRPIQWRSKYRSAQSEGTPGWKYFQLSMPKIGLGASYELTEERRTDGDTETETVATNREVNEWLELDMDGSIYNPALIAFSQYVKFEWRQLESELDEQPATESEGFLLGYDTRLSVLKDKPYTLDLYALRNQDTYSSPFVSRTQTDTTQYGADLRFKYRTMPTTLSYSHSESEQEGFYNSTDIYDTLDAVTSVAGLTYTGSYEERERTTDETYASDVQSTDHYLRGDHFLDKAKKIRLKSLASYRRTTSNTLDYATASLTERLLWQHGRTLESDYEARYQRSVWEESENRSTSAQARITHLLYENLVTRLSGSYAREDFDENSETTYGGLLDLGYNRRIPGGHLYINLSNEYEVIDRNVVERFSQITDEPHVLSTGTVTLLNRENIDVGTIVVTDPTGTIIYIQGIDYRITVIERSTRISRLPLGAIADGGSVLVSYGYVSNPAYDSSLYTQAYDARVFLWSALTLSLRYRSVDERLLSGIPPENSSDSESWGAGLNWVWRWTETSIDYDETAADSGISTQRWTAEESLTLRPLRSIFWGIRGRYQKTDFTDIDATEDAYGVIVNHDWRPRRWLAFELQSSWRKISGTFEESIDKETDAGIKLFYRIWNLGIRYRYIDHEDRITGDRRSEKILFFELFRKRW